MNAEYQLHSCKPQTTGFVPEKDEEIVFLSSTAMVKTGMNSDSLWIGVRWIPSRWAQYPAIQPEKRALLSQLTTRAVSEPKIKQFRKKMMLLLLFLRNQLASRFVEICKILECWRSYTPVWWMLVFLETATDYGCIATTYRLIQLLGKVVLHRRSAGPKLYFKTKKAYLLHSLVLDSLCIHVIQHLNVRNFASHIWPRFGAKKQPFRIQMLQQETINVTTTSLTSRWRHCEWWSRDEARRKCRASGAPALLVTSHWAKGGSKRVQLRLGWLVGSAKAVFWFKKLSDCESQATTLLRNMNTNSAMTKRPPS